MSTAHAILSSSESNEWYTPRAYLEAARATMEGIDLDPASCEAANAVVQADHYFTKAANGLDQRWQGRVWLNPPYGKTNGVSNQEVWSHRLIHAFECGDVSQAVLLVNAVPGNAWFAPLWPYTLCFVSSRIKFWRPGEINNQPTHSNVFVYFGDHVERFADHFSQFGPVVRVVRPRQGGIVLQQHLGV